MNLFEINGTSGHLSFKTGADFEEPHRFRLEQTV